jgi:hypothetical protein
MPAKKIWWTAGARRGVSHAPDDATGGGRLTGATVMSPRAASASGPGRVVNRAAGLYGVPGENHCSGAASNRSKTDLACSRPTTPAPRPAWREHVSDAQYSAIGAA